MSRLILLAAWGVTSAVMADETVDGHRSYAGAGLLVGWTGQHDVQRSEGRPITRAYSDTDGINGGVFGYYGWRWQRHPAWRSEFALTGRFRHDLNIAYDVHAGVPSPALAKANVQTVDLVASVLRDLPRLGKWQPYAGVGAGVVRTRAESYVLRDQREHGPGDSRSDRIWQVRLGADYSFNERWQLRLDYRYADMGKVSTGVLATGDAFTAKLDSHDIRVGLSRNF